MRQFIVILLLSSIGQCYAGAFDVDTIDNWQIYNGTELVFGGHAWPEEIEFQGTIKTTTFKDLVIQFNHCSRYTNLDVDIEVTDDKGKTILMKKFRIDSGSSMTIDKKELGPLTMKSIIIRYRERRNNGTDKILGRVNFA
jgi:hypothetical protein